MRKNPSSLLLPLAAALGCLLWVQIVPAQPQPFTLLFGENDRFEQGAAVRQTRDGKIFFTGTSAADSVGGFDVWLACFDAGGHPLWARAYGSLVADYPQGMWLAGDSLLLIAGNRYDFDLPRQEAFLLAVDTAGQQRWYRTYGDSLRNAAFKTVQPLPGGDFIAAGYITDPSGGSNDSYVVRLDPVGNLRWQSPLRDSLIDVAQGVMAGPEGSILVVGDRQQPGGHYNAYAARLDSLGEVVWVLPFASPLNGGAQTLMALRDSTYLMIGESPPDSSTSSFDFYLACFTAEGVARWRRYLGGPGGDAAFAGYQATSGDLYLAGYGFDSLTGQTDALVMRCDSQGAFLAQRYYGGPGIDHAYGMVPARDGGYLVAGFSAMGIDNQFLLIYDSLAVQTTTHLAPSGPLPKLWPQPVSPGQRLQWQAAGRTRQVSLLDPQGRVVARALAPGTGWRLPADLPAGRYWLRLDQTEGIQVQAVQVE